MMIGNLLPESYSPKILFNPSVNHSFISKDLVQWLEKPRIELEHTMVVTIQFQ